MHGTDPAYASLAPWAECGFIAAGTPGFAAYVRAGVAEADAEGRELLGDLLAGQRRGERDVGVAAVVALPGAAGLDGADPGHGAVHDIDHPFEPALTDGCDGPPLTVGFELDGFAPAGLAVPAVRAGVDLAGRVLR